MFCWVVGEYLVDFVFLGIVEFVVLLGEVVVDFV